MKKLLTLAALCVCTFAAQAQAADVTFAWDAVTGADGYRFYVAGSNGTAVLVGTAAVSTTPTFTVPSANPGTYTAFVTAFNTAGESGPSGGVQYTVTAPVTIPLAPANLRRTFPVKGAVLLNAHP